MKIIDAYWEKENLGLTTTEIIVENDDLPGEIEDILNGLKSEYHVVKVPVGFFEQCIIMSKLGYTFIEGMVDLVRDMDEVVVPYFKTDINNRLRLEKMDDASFEYMLKRVSNGLYDKDRISLDPFFSESQSSNRYHNWLIQEWNAGNEFYKLMYEDDYIGYLDLKQIDKSTYRDVMTGIFPEYRGKGYAMGFTTKLIDLLRRRGAEEVYGAISTNNTSSLQSRMRYGYIVDTITYIFVKHLTNGGAQTPLRNVNINQCFLRKYFREVAA